MVTDGREGFLFEAGNLPQLVDLLGLMLRDGGLRRKISRKAKIQASKFPLDEVNDKIFQISLEALAKSSRTVQRSNTRLHLAPNLKTRKEPTGSQPALN